MKVSGNLQCNDGEVLTRWALAGEGLALRSAWEVSEEIKRGRLVSVLDEFAVPGNNIHAVFPERRLLPAKVRFFIEHPEEGLRRPALLGVDRQVTRRGAPSGSTARRRTVAADTLQWQPFRMVEGGRPVVIGVSGTPSPRAAAGG